MASRSPRRVAAAACSSKRLAWEVLRRKPSYRDLWNEYADAVQRLEEHAASGQPADDLDTVQARETEHMLACEDCRSAGNCTKLLKIQRSSSTRLCETVEELQDEVLRQFGLEAPKDPATEYDPADDPVPPIAWIRAGRSLIPADNIQPPTPQPVPLEAIRERAEARKERKPEVVAQPSTAPEWPMLERRAKRRAKWRAESDARNLALATKACEIAEKEEDLPLPEKTHSLSPDGKHLVRPGRYADLLTRDVTVRGASKRLLTLAVDIDQPMDVLLLAIEDALGAIKVGLRADAPAVQRRLRSGADWMDTAFKVYDLREDRDLAGRPRLPFRLIAQMIFGSSEPAAVNRAEAQYRRAYELIHGGAPRAWRPGDEQQDDALYQKQLRHVRGCRRCASGTPCADLEKMSEERDARPVHQTLGVDHRLEHAPDATDPEPLRKIDARARGRGRRRRYPR